MYYLIVILKLVQSMLWYDKVLLVTFLSCTCIVWVNKPNAGLFLLFFLYLYAHSITYLVHLQSVQKFALTEFTSFYCMHLKWCIPRSVLLIIQIYALYFLIPWSFICSFTKKWNSLFHRGWYNCFMTCYRLVLTQKYFKGFRLTNNIFK